MNTTWIIALSAAGATAAAVVAYILGRRAARRRRRLRALNKLVLSGDESSLALHLAQHPDEEVVRRVIEQLREQPEPSAEAKPPIDAAEREQPADATEAERHAEPGAAAPPMDADPQFGGGADNIAFLTGERLGTGSRYANATLLDGRTGGPWGRSQPIRPGDLLWLWVDIGRLSARSQVEEPVPFPDRYLPAGDLTIDVVVSSTTFTVTSDPAEIARRPETHAATGQLVVPGDGGPARAADGEAFLWFGVGAPESAGTARLRIAYYFRDAIVQSQLLTAAVAEPRRPGTWSLRTDYTITDNLPGVADIPARQRVAVVLNGDGGSHEIYVRAPGPAGAKPPPAGVPQAAAAVSLPPAIGDAVRAMRRTLASEPVAPTSMAQSRSQLITAMRQLAPLGWGLYAAVFPGLRDILYALETEDGVVLHVARPAGVTLSVPWALLYTTPLDSRYAPGYEKVPVCPLVTQWDGRTPLISGGETRCPHATDDPAAHAADLLCPFGFLGFRHDIEQLSSAERPVVTITAPSGSRAVIAETTYQVNTKALQQHVAGLRDAFTRLRGIDVQEAPSKDLLKQLVCADVPLVYFFCHGERPRADSRETYLGIGNREFLTPADFIGWVQEAFLSSQLRIWNQIRPLIFINACHSAELDPAALFNYIDVFVTAANAAGVIGTEVKVSQDLAMEFARRFFDELLSPGATVGTAMRSARMAFLSKGNLFGLNYTPYCWADLAVAPAL